jgi:hypothetical protein
VTRPTTGGGARRRLAERPEATEDGSRPEGRRLRPRARPRAAAGPALLGWYGGGDPAAGTLLSVSLWSTAEAAHAADARPSAAEVPGSHLTFEALGARFDLPEVYEAILRA